jgi:hypothetical protein
VKTVTLFQHCRQLCCGSLAKALGFVKTGILKIFIIKLNVVLFLFVLQPELSWGAVFGPSKKLVKIR